MKKALLIWALFSQAATGQTPAAPAPKPAAARPAAAPAKPATGLDAVIALVKAKMSEGLILKAIAREGKAYDLSAADMVKLQQAGVSEKIIEALMSPASAAPAPAAAAAPEPEPVSAPTPVASRPRPLVKRRLAVMPFDHSAVAQWVHYWFRSDYNVGQGIRAMLTTRLAKSKSIVLLERARMDAIEKELAYNNTSKVNQGTKVKTGKISGADCMLMGDIVIFGRDDKAESSRTSASSIGRSVFNRLGGRVGAQAASMGQFSKEEKAVVAIALRIVDTETGEVLETAEARGESKRQSKSWDAFAYGGGSGVQADSNAMTSSNFQATIIGEATSDAVDKVVAYLEDKIPQMTSRSRMVEGRVAKVTANSVILGIGSTDGVQAGDRFEIHKILDEVVDPVSKEVLDVQTVKVGELLVDSPREKKISTGTYSGQALAPTWAKGYTARLVQ